MKTAKTVRSTEEYGAFFGQLMKLIEENHLVEMVIRYKLKQPILLKKGTSKCYPVYASPEHPKSKQVHEFVIRLELKTKHLHVRVPGKPYQIRNHRSHRKNNAA